VIEIPRLRAPIWAAVLLLGAGLAIQTAPVSQAAVCGSVGGARVDVSGCADPISEFDDYVPPPPPPPDAPPPPPPPPPPAYVPPPPPPVDVSACASVGRRVSVSGCV